MQARLGRYEILSTLGQGGMAEVFLARSRGPGGVEKLVCVKRVRPALIEDPRVARRFVDEARAALSLRHANIVPVFELGRHGQELFLVMEWIDGCDLGRLLDHARGAGRPLPPTVAAHVAAEVAKALAYAHEHGERGRPTGLVHRDVTPRNVLLSRAGEIRLADFGISRALGAAGTAAGTPRYMAPEQARGEPPVARDDLYSLGLVLAEMLAGSPLRADNTLEAASRPVDPPSLPGAPPALAAIAQRLLAPEAAARFDRAADVAAALSRVLAEAVVRGEPAPGEALARLVADVAPGPPVAPGAATALTAAPATVDGPEPAAAPTPRTASIASMIRSAAVLVVVAVAGAIATRSYLHRRAPPVADVRAPVAAPAPVAVPPGAAPLAAPGAPPVVVQARAPAPARPAPRAAPAPRPARRPAQLRILAPGSWVAVYLDGRKLGDDAGSFSIPPGRHELRVENPPLGFQRSETIDVGEDEVVERTYRPGL